MGRRRLAAALLFAAASLAASEAVAQQGQRASVQDVSKAVRGEETAPIGPGGVPQPPKAEDGRDYVYLDVVRVTAIRERRAARTYAVWPRITVAKEHDPAVFAAAAPRLMDALVTTLSEMAQVDWPGEARMDLSLAAELAKTQAEAIVGAGELDALDFVHVEVQIF